MAKNEKNFKYNKYNAFAVVFLVIFSFVFGIVLFNGGKQVKAETNIYEELAILSKNYVVDYTAPENYSNYGITITNNQDGTFTLTGTTTAVVSYRFPLTIENLEGYCKKVAPDATNNDYLNYGIMWQVFKYKTSDNHLYGGNNDNGPAITTRISNLDSYKTYTPSSGSGQWGNVQARYLNYIQISPSGGGLSVSKGYDKYMEIQIGQGVNVDDLSIMPVFFDNIPTYPYANNSTPGVLAISVFEYLNSFIGPSKNTDVYYATEKPQAGYYIYQKVNEQLGVDLLPAIRYTLTADTTEITKDSALTLESANIDVLKLTAPNGNIYRVYYDNITSSNTKDSYFVEDNGTTTILQNADGSGLINSTGLDALILALQHALTYNAVITTADHYIFNLCSYLYVFDTDFGYAKGVQEGSANYQPGQSGYNTIYNAGKLYGEEQKDNYYNSYYGGSNGVGGAGYTSIYNAGKEAGATITTSWLTTVLNTVVVVFALELLPGIKLGYIIGAPFVISVIWFIIRQFRGGGSG